MQAIYQQKLYQGDFYTNLVGAIKNNKVKKFFCVAGKTSFEKTGAKAVLDKITDIEYTLYNDFSPNPKYEDMLGGITALKQCEADIVLAIGGGSAMDIAKLIVTFADKKIIEYDKYMTLQKSLDKAICPLWAVPITSGSGAEATHFAVVYYNGKKYSIPAQSMLPNIVFLDSVLTHSTPKNIARASGIDALCQGLESYWAVDATTESQKLATQAIDIVIKNFKQAMNGDAKALKNLQYGAYLAGGAINISKTTAGHAFSYHLTQKYTVLHGNAVALMLSFVFEYALMYGDKQALKKCSELSTLLKIEINQLPSYLLTLLSEMEAVNTLQEVGVDTQEKINILCDTVNTERLHNNPVSIELNKFKQLLGTKI